MPSAARLSWRLAAGLAALYAGLIVLPHLLSFSQKEVAVFLLINTLLVVSYRVLTLTGEWSLGHVVIMGVGGYASALISKRLVEIADDLPTVDVHLLGRPGHLYDQPVAAADRGLDRPLFRGHSGEKTVLGQHHAFDHPV